jgi:polysaccharide biosynthesis transport protein
MSSHVPSTPHGPSAPHRRQPSPARGARAPTPITDLYGAHAPTHDDPALDYRKYLAILFKHRWLIAGVTAISLAVGLFYTLLQTPTYRASATIEIKREAANFSGIAGLESVEASRGGEFYQTQYELLKSRALAERVVAGLGLADMPRFYEPRPSGWVKLRQLALRSGHADAPGIADRQALAVEAVLEGLSVEPVRASSIVRINFDSADAGLAQQVADALADTFITSTIERNFEASAYARAFLEERLQELRLKLEESERELVAYAEAQDILASGSEQPLSTINLAGTNVALGKAGEDRLRHELRWQQALAADGADLPQSLESPAIQELRAQRNEAALAYEHKLQDFKPAYPEMVRLGARIGKIDRQIAAEVERIRQSLRGDYESAMKQEQALLRRMGELKAEVMDYQNRNIRYTILRREVDTNRSLYEGLLQRYKEIGVAGGIDIENAASNVSIVDRAQVPDAPYKPRPALNLAVALVAGLALGGAAAFGREFLDNSFRTPEELEEDLGLPLLGIIPFSNDITGFGKVLDHHRSPPVEAYRSLRAALQFSTAAGAPKSLVVTSALQGEGKSTAAANIAAQFARMAGACSSSMPICASRRCTGCSAAARQPGLSQYLADGSAPPEALQATVLPGLSLLPGGPVATDPTALLSGARMASLVSLGAEEFDLVVVDAPPVGGLADAPLLASLCVGTLVVVEANKTHRRAVMAAVKRLRFARAEIVGVLLNKFDARQAGDAYGYGYGDHGYYGYEAEARQSLPGAGAG